MPQFQYKAIGGDGKMTEGVLDVGGRQEAFRQIETKGLRLVSLKEKTGGKAVKG